MKHTVYFQDDSKQIFRFIHKPHSIRYAHQYLTLYEQERMVEFQLLKDFGRVDPSYTLVLF
jgi:hypothetical protein